MIESLFETLFKYRPLVFGQGDFTLAVRWPVLVAGLGVGVGAVLVVLTYARVRGKSRSIDRAVLGALRLAIFAVLIFCLFRPALVLSTVVPQQNFLGILIDDSLSMQIADLDDQPRHTFVHESLGTPDSPLRAALAERFTLRMFRFSDTAERLTDAADLGFTGTQTRLGTALERARAELAGVPLAGLVVVTDGADTSRSALAESLVPLAAAGVPVYTVGVGREALSRDIQLSRVETPRRVLEGAALVVDVIVAQTGYAGSTVSLQVEDDGRIVSAQDVELPADGEPRTVRMRFTASDVGPRLFSFRIPPQPGEMVTENNLQEALIVVENEREKILYFEGEPRFEVKFIRRAIDEDDNLQVVVLQRAAENKYLRLDVDDPEDLAGGFPRTREELFTYKGLIIGSVEASFFTADQLRMLADFVDQRGGGLLMLGSRHSFAEGGYAGTAVADVLPVLLDPPAAGAEPVFTQLQVKPTRAGATHMATQVADSEEASAERWTSLPAVSSLNRITTVKPGATTLLTGEPDGGGPDRVVLSYQRYGRGKALAFPIQDSWLWQMHADVPLEDMTHELLWRRLLRWLVDGVPDQVAVSAVQERVEPGDPVTVMARVEDAGYLRMNSSHVEAEVIAPSGESRMVTLDWTVERDGEYEATFVPDEVGLYEVRVAASRDDESIGRDVAYVQSVPSDSEYFDAGMRAPLLRRVADETGGQYYTTEDVDSLPDDIAYTGGGVTVVEEKELWDMPVLLILLVGLMGTEWGFRRIRGLA